MIWQLPKNMHNINVQFLEMPVHVLYNICTLGFTTTVHSDTWELIARNETIVHVQTPFLPSQMYILLSKNASWELPLRNVNVTI